MKSFQIRLPFSILFFALIAFFSLTSCGGGKEDNSETVASVETVETPVIMTDSQAIMAANSDIMGDTMKQDVKADAKKVIPSTVISKETSPVKASTEKTVVATNTKPVTNATTTPVVQPQVVKVTEPVKQAPEVAPVPTPKTVEVPKPAAPVASAPTQQSDWKVPANYLNMTSKFPADKESLAMGKSLYSTHCRSCHGSKGDGNGTKAATIDTKIGSFLSAQFRAQKPGEVYYKSIIGRKDMPRFDKKIPDEEERWAIVNYIRSL